MAKRKIIKIDEEKCNGCGLCVTGCAEGALQIIDGKAKLVKESFCDGLGACIGECPQGALTIEEREADKFSEEEVKKNLQHKANECPGSKAMDFSSSGQSNENDLSGKRPSQLRHWPVQFHLITPLAPYFKNKDVVLSADCVAYPLGDFHKDFLKDKSLIIACPKLDQGMEIYEQKLISLIDEAKINTLTVMIMEVPCCRGLLSLAKQASEKAKRKIPIKLIIVGIKGNILQEEWV